MKRHEDTLAIMEGARNVRAIAKSLLDAADEAAGEGISAEQDAAVRLIVHRLSKVCKVDEIDYGYDSVTLTDTFCTLVQECKTRSTERYAKTFDVEDQIIVLRPALSERPERGQG
jgi:hypothetical protein